MTPLTITLAQLSGSVFGRSYLPYAPGLLQAYVLGHAPDPHRYTFALPPFQRGPAKEIAQKMAGQDIAGFSVYMWNRNLSLEVARQLKALSPQTLILMGGPEIPQDSEAFLRANPQVDILCHGEGEALFLALLESLPEGDRAQVPGISYLDGEGHYHHTLPLPRIQSLNDIPSPFLSGTFDALIDANPDVRWLSVWETNRGCPFRCTFCDWGQATGAKVIRFPESRAKAEIDWFAAHKVEFVFCCDANFGILPRDLDIARHVAQVRAETGYPKEMSIQNTKNATDRAYAVHHILHEAGLNREVVLSLQSVDAPTLKAIRRKNISLETFAELQRRFAEDGVPTYTDVLIGLPGESLQAFSEGIGAIIKGGQRNRIKFYTLTALPNCELGSPAYREEHGVELMEVPLVDLHRGDADGPFEIEETHKLVIATKAMPRGDWVKARCLAWMVELIYFSRLLQAPIDALHGQLAIPFEACFEALCDAEAGPSLERIRHFLRDKAQALQEGGHEHCPPAPWTHRWAATPDYVRCSLAESGYLASFYQDCVEILAQLGEKERGAPGRAFIEASAALNWMCIPGS